MARIIWERIGQLKYWQMKHIFGRWCITRTQLGRLQTIVKLARKWKKKTYHQTCFHSSKDSLMNACRNTLWIKRWTLTGVNRAIFAATTGENIIKSVLQKSVCKFFTNPFFTNPIPNAKLNSHVQCRKQCVLQLSFFSYLTLSLSLSLPLCLFALRRIHTLWLCVPLSCASHFRAVEGPRSHLIAIEIVRKPIAMTLRLKWFAVVISLEIRRAVALVVPSTFIVGCKCFLDGL